MRKLTFVVAVTFLLALAVTGCGENSNEQNDGQGGNQVGQTGVLEFRANGEDFVRKGFTSKDGWEITFNHVYVNMAGITAYQAKPAYNAEEGGEVEAKTKAGLKGTYTVDLARGGENATSVLVGQLKDVPAGHYNAIAWKMVNAKEGPAQGYSLVIDGKAAKDGKVVNFVIKDGTEYKYTGGEYIGGERKGIVQPGEKGELEMTFHFDHVFGDAGVPAGDELNTGAPGFAPFAGTAVNGKVEISVAELAEKMDAEAYRKLEHMLATLGHVGEGHCHCEILSD